MIVDEDDQDDYGCHEGGQKDENDDCAFIAVGHRAISLIWTQSSSHIADEDDQEDIRHSY